jgi:hypothetical protein
VNEAETVAIPDEQEGSRWSRRGVATQLVRTADPGNRLPRGNCQDGVKRLQRQRNPLDVSVADKERVPCLSGMCATFHHEFRLDPPRGLRWRRNNFLFSAKRSQLAGRISVIFLETTLKSVPP